MGSVNHPKFFDPDEMSIVKATFHEVWDVVEGQDALVIEDQSGRLKATIIRTLIDLVSDGITDKEQLKAEALRHLPLSGSGRRSSATALVTLASLTAPHCARARKP